MKTSPLPIRDASIATPLAQYHLIKYFDSSVRRDRIVIIWRLVSKTTDKVRIERCGKKVKICCTDKFQDPLDLTPDDSSVSLKEALQVFLEEKHCLEVLSRNNLL